ncbi:exosortase-associated protein EpsI, B-type [Deefgea rivuli]|uniref:exosortase-associated protein EpsI, B-type n=1 Tax=Deefgea rivuli TaxID=400948 RepID=UPI0006848F33|nr:exosortase-associated protein EpsI, B-type [Deefgea rivuli]
MRLINQVLILMLMLCSAAAAYFLTPSEFLADSRKITLEEMVPQEFGSWKIDKNIPVVETPAELQATIDKTYTETLSRTYIDSSGRQVMLSIAYGRNQSDGNNIHRPEVCYPAQGFSVFETGQRSFKLDGSVFKLNQLIAKNNNRIEPVSYWMVIGDKKVLSNRTHKIEQIKMGMKGVIPDGLLFRVSTLGLNSEREYKIQEDFIVELRKNIKPKHLDIIFGEEAGT